jgi:hypothetical protein
MAMKTFARKRIRRADVLGSDATTPTIAFRNGGCNALPTRRSHNLAASRTRHPNPFRYQHTCYENIYYATHVRNGTTRNQHEEYVESDQSGGTREVHACYRTQRNR